MSQINTGYIGPIKSKGIIPWITDENGILYDNINDSMDYINGFDNRPNNLDSRDHKTKLKVFYSHLENIDDFLRFINKDYGEEVPEAVQKLRDNCKNSLIFVKEHSQKSQDIEVDDNVYLTELFVDSMGKCTIIGSSRYNVFAAQVKYEILDLQKYVNDCYNTHHELISNLITINDELSNSYLITLNQIKNIFQRNQYIDGRHILEDAPVQDLANDLCNHLSSYLGIQGTQNAYTGNMGTERIVTTSDGLTGYIGKMSTFNMNINQQIKEITKTKNKLTILQQQYFNS